VSWRYGDGYLGWAPLAPTWYWHSGYAVAFGVVPVMPYVFCPYDYVFYPQPAPYVVVGPTVPAIAARTRPWYPAQPAVGRTAASPRVNGPPPKDIGLQAKTTPVPNDRGMLKAQQLARPSTAVNAGARPPSIAPAPRGAPLSQRGPAGSPNYTGAYRPAPGAAYGTSRPQGSTPIGVQAPAYTRAPTPAPLPGYARPGFSSTSPSAVLRPQPSMPSTSFSRPAPFPNTPSFSRPAPSMPSTPSFSRPAPSMPPPSFSRPTFSAPSQSFSRPSAPSQSFSRPSIPSGGGGGGGRTFARPR
jgi:hypothetical protein